MIRSHSFGQLLNFARDGAVVLLEVFGVLQDAVEVLLWTRREQVLRWQETQASSSPHICLTSVHYLMLLPAFALLLNLLLLLQLLCDSGFSQRLALASLVGLGVEGGL